MATQTSAGTNKDEFDELYRLEHTQHFTPERTEYKVATLSELINFSSTAGLAVTTFHGNWQLEPYTAQSPKMMLVTRKEV